MGTLASYFLPVTLQAQGTATEQGPFFCVVLHLEIAAQITVASSAAHLLSFLLSEIGVWFCKNKQIFACIAYHTMGCHWNAFFVAIFMVYIVFL